MTDNVIDPKILAEFLDMGGPDMRGALLAQVQSDLETCHDALAQAVAATTGDVTALCNTAHEIKGLAATIGATDLAALAAQVEQACKLRDTATVTAMLPRLTGQTEQTAQAVATLAQAN